MKILVADDQAGAMSWIYLSTAKALAACGHDVTIWDIKRSPPNDALDLYEPQILMMPSYCLTRSCVDSILERPWLKTVLRSSDFGPLQKDIDLNKYPILVANDDEKRHVAKLVENNALSFLHCHYLPNRIPQTHGFWQEMGCEVFSLLSGADVFDYTHGAKMPEFECDVCFIGGSWKYKGITLEKYLIPLRSKVHLKVFGNQPWGIPEYCGTLPNEYVKHAFASATVCPNVSEPHSQDFGYDIIERPYKLLSNRCFVVSDYVEDMPAVFGDGIVYAKTPEEFHHLVEHYVKNPELREPIIQKGYDTVIGGQTYFHRVARMFEYLGMDNEASHCLSVYEEVKQKLNL